MTNRKGLAGQGSARSDLRESIHSWTKSTLETFQGRRNLVPASRHTTSGETLVHAPWDVFERASSAGSCLSN